MSAPEAERPVWCPRTHAGRPTPAGAGGPHRRRRRTAHTRGTRGCPDPEIARAPYGSSPAPAPLPLALSACGGGSGGELGQRLGDRHDPAGARLLQQRAGQHGLPEGPRGVRPAGRRHHPARGRAWRRADPEGAAAGLVEDAPRRPDAGQPRPAADRRDRRPRPAERLRPLGRRLRRRAWSSASTYNGKLYGLQPITNTIGLFYNNDMLAKAGRHAADHLGGAADGGQEAHLRRARTGSRSRRRPTTKAPGSSCRSCGPTAATRRTSRRRRPRRRCSCGSTWSTPARRRSPLVNWTQADVNDQFPAGKAAMMVNGPWQFPALDEVTSLNYDVVPIPAPAAGKPVVAPLGGETWTVPQTGNKDRQAKAAKIVACLNSDDNQLSLATEQPDHADQDRAAGRSSLAATRTMAGFATRSRPPGRAPASSARTGRRRPRRSTRRSSPR